MIKRILAAFASLCLLGVVVWVFQNNPEDTSGPEPAQYPKSVPDYQVQHSSAHVDDGIIIGVQTEESTGIAAFEEWLKVYANSPENERDQLVNEGLGIARNRRSEMKTLIRSDPQRALAHAIDYDSRNALPSSIRAELETPVSSHVAYELLVYCLDPYGESERMERWANLGDVEHEVFTYGRRLNVNTKYHLSLHGIALDGLIAMDESPVRQLGDSERTHLGIESELVVAVGDQYYSAVDESALQRLRSILLEDEYHLGPYPSRDRWALEVGDIEGLSKIVSEASTSISDSYTPELQSDHTEGAKKMLYIRARFSNQDADYEPNTLATLMERQADCEAYWFENSYGKSSLTTIFTDVITLPNSASYYADLTSGRLNALFEDALPLVKAAGDAKGQDWDESNYDFYTMLTTGGTWGYAGVAGVGGRRSHLNGAGSSNVRTASHEFGHNLGLRHANYWRTDSTSPIGRDSIPGGYVGDDVGDERIEYGHRHSVMGAQNGSGDLNEGRGHYTTGEKVHLDWLVSENGDWASVDASTTNPIRLFRNDVESEFFDSMTAGVIRAIKINRDSGDYAANNKRRYWLSYRILPTNGVSEDWLPFGVQVDWQREVYGGDGSIQLDMTPYSRDDTNTNPNARRDNSDKEDAVLVVGKTYSDSLADIHITPVGRGGENPNEWLDVIINLDTQANNRRPDITSFSGSTLGVDTGEVVSFNVEATDPDGDELYYNWSFGDASLDPASLNSTTAEKSWEDRGIYPVRVTVTDAKGGTDTEEILVQVGPSSGRLAIRGRVIHAGLPVEGARVTSDFGEAVWTDGNGEYQLIDLRPETHTIGVAKDGLEFVPLFVNPVYLSNLDAYGRDWVAIDDGSPGDDLQLAITPYHSVVPLGTDLQLTTLAWDSSGKQTNVQPIWSLEGQGGITQNGIYSATTLGGPYVVTASVGASQAQALIQVEDIQGVGITTLTPEIVESDAAFAMYRIRRYGSSAGELQVYFAWNGSAERAKDYIWLDEPFVFADGESAKDLRIDLLDDSEVENTETLIFAILPDDRYTIYSAEASAVVRIEDDSDVGPSIQITSPKEPLAFVPDGTGLLIETEVTDDGFPQPPGKLTHTWSLIEGPEGSRAYFTKPDSDTTVVKFGSPGFYRVALTASDGVNFTTEELGIHAGLNPESVPSEDNEIIYYTFDDGEGSTATDAQGGDNHGDLINDPLWTGEIDSILNGGIYLDGMDDQIDIADSPDINLSDHSQRTIAVWFKADNPGLTSKQVLYEEGGGTRGLNIYLSEGHLYVGGWNGGGNSWDETFLNVPLADSKWHHVALVLDSAVSTDLQEDVFRGYLDGKEFGRGSAATLDPHSGDIAIGANHDATKFHDGNSNGTGDHFAGFLDEFHLWNRSLSAVEIGQLFSRGYTGPDIEVLSMDTTRGAVVLPSGMGFVFKAEGSSDLDLSSQLRPLETPVGEQADIVVGEAGIWFIRFSGSGYYQFRYIVEDDRQKSAFDFGVHAGLAADSNPSIAEEEVYLSFDTSDGSVIHNEAGEDFPVFLDGEASWISGIDALHEGAVAIGVDGGYLRLPDNSPIGAEAVKKSYSVWIRPSEDSSGEPEVVFHWGRSDEGMSVYVDDSAVYAGAWEDAELAWSTYLSAPLTRNQWHHVVLVLDAETKYVPIEHGLKLYLNGELVASGRAGGTGGHGASRIGGIHTETLFHDGSEGRRFENSFRGTIDEFHYYQDHALSMDEIGQLYAFGNRGPVVDAGIDQTGLVDFVVPLSGSATDDGRWLDLLDYEWLIYGRPGTGTIPNANASDTEVEFLAGGRYDVALSVSDGQVTSFDTVSVSIDQPTYFDQFMDEYPSLADQDREYLSNPDLDLWTNLEEYAFGGAPNQFDVSGELWIQSQLVMVGDERYFEFRFPKRIDAPRRGLNYLIDFSQDLSPGSWKAMDYSVEEIISISADFEELKIRVEEPINAETYSVFARVRVVLDE